MSQEKMAHQADGIWQSVNVALCGIERRGWIELHDRAIAVRQERALARSDGTDLSAADSSPVGQLTATRVVI